MNPRPDVQLVDIDRVFLDLRNPRHEPYASEDDAIYYLCSRENVLALAKDIVLHGLNPLEQFGLIPDGDESYIAAEGNRRLCALKLLHDPERAPDPGLRRAFERAAEGWDPIHEIPAVVFETRTEVKLWLERIHAGFAGGRGRRQWNAEQKTRHTGYDKNRGAQTVLDVAEKEGFITREAREGRLSTVQRYISNPIFRNTLGLETSDPTNITTTLAEEDFPIVFRRFMADVAAKRVHTRDNKEVIEKYANELTRTEGLSGERGLPRAIRSPDSDDTPGPDRPTPPRVRRIRSSEELEAALEATGNFKLRKIYYSLRTLSLASHTPLLTVGAWVFVETLTALAGRKDNASFESFLNARRLENLGLGKGQKTKAIRQAITRLMENGNTTKHDQTAAAFNGETLSNDWDTMEEMLIALARQVANP